MYYDIITAELADGDLRGYTCHTFCRRVYADTAGSASSVLQQQTLLLKFRKWSECRMEVG
jgi:hypothetical protein